MELGPASWDFDRRISGNTQAGRKRYTRCVRRAMRQAQHDPAYARHILDRLGLYDENGLFRGNEQECLF